MRNPISKISAFTIIPFLIIIDQLIKNIIRNNYMHLEFNILEKILAFKPHVNTNYSWINSIFDLKMGLVTHLIIIFTLLLLTYFVYDFLRTKKLNYQIVKVSFSFLVSGILCALIDIIFWGGSLDFIWLKGFFIFDIKDCYITTFEILIAILFIKNFKAVWNFKSREFFQHLIIKLRSINRVNLL